MVNTSGRRTRRVRSHPPRTLEESLSIARAIQQDNSGIPFDRGLLAKAIGSTCDSSSFMQKLNSSAAYGLTIGGYRDENISITPRGEACTTPRTEEELQTALLEAALAPDIFRKFYNRLDGKEIPKNEYVQNLLQRELGVPSNLTSECFDIIKANGIFADVIQSSGTGSFKVTLGRSQPGGDSGDGIILLPRPDTVPPKPTDPVSPFIPQITNSRIFVAGNKTDQMTNVVKNLLNRFSVNYHSADLEPFHGPLIPEEISERMKLCNSGILFIREIDDVHSPKNNSAILFTQLLGAASVLYGEKIVIVCEGNISRLSSDYPTIKTICYDPIYPANTSLELLTFLHTLELIDAVP
tara:strand:- start:2340 stop:3398 length:1059 start_codon:yes stop_codon:yes gene_type:complete